MCVDASVTVRCIDVAVGPHGRLHYCIHAVIYAAPLARPQNQPLCSCYTAGQYMSCIVSFRRPGACLHDAFCTPLASMQSSLAEAEHIPLPQPSKHTARASTPETCMTSRHSCSYASFRHLSDEAQTSQGRLHMGPHTNSLLLAGSTGPETRHKHNGCLCPGAPPTKHAPFLHQPGFPAQLRPCMLAAESSL